MHAPPHSGSAGWLVAVEGARQSRGRRGPCTLTWWAGSSGHQRASSSESDSQLGHLSHFPFFAHLLPPLKPDFKALRVSGFKRMNKINTEICMKMKQSRINGIHLQGRKDVRSCSMDSELYFKVIVKNTW